MKHLFKDHDLQLNEREISEILYHYPYLIDKTLTNPRKEVIFKDKTRADFVFFLEEFIVVVEVKKGKLSTQNVDQIVHYMKMVYEKEKKSVKGILIGLKIENKEFYNYMRSKRFEICIKLFGKDIPTIFKICERCRKVNAYHSNMCWFCNSDEWLDEDLE